MPARNQDTDGYSKKGKGAAKKQPTERIPFNEYVFVRIELTQDEKTDLKANYIPDINFAHVLDDLVISGYKLSLAQQGEQPTWIATLSCGDRADDNGGLSLSARGYSASAALACLGYKVLVLAEDKPWRQVESERGGGYDNLG